MEKSLRFLELVQTSIVERGRGTDDLSPALKAAAAIPTDVAAEEACGTFLRWYYQESPKDGDGWLLGVVNG